MEDITKDVKARKENLKKRWRNKNWRTWNTEDNVNFYGGHDVASHYYLYLEYHTNSNFIKLMDAIDRVRRLKYWHEKRMIGNESIRGKSKWWVKPWGSSNDNLVSSCVRWHTKGNTVKNTQLGLKFINSKYMLMNSVYA